jgi:AcrR family transcriptional regulator
MSPKPDVSEARKKQIMEAAISVFNRNGFNDSRMDDIVEEAGISKGTVYWYFKNKEELIISILDHIFGEEFSRMEKADDSTLPPRQCLTRYFDLYIKDLTVMMPFAPIIYEFYALAFRNKTVKTVMQGYLKRFVNSVEPIIQRGIESGDFQKVDSRFVAMAFGSQIEGTLLLWAYAPDSMAVEKQLRVGINMLLFALERTDSQNAN